MFCNERGGCVDLPQQSVGGKQKDGFTFYGQKRTLYRN